MINRKKYKSVTKPYWHSDHIICYYELDFGKDTIKPGDKITFKNTRGHFVFQKWVHNATLDKTWIDCMDPKTFESKSFYMEKLKGVVRAKKSIRKKLV